MLPFNTLTETIHEGAYIVSEANGYRSRKTISMSNAVALVSGTVMCAPGAPAAATATVGTGAGNTGNGTLTMDPTAPIAAAAIDGGYMVEMLTATTFNVLDPKGKIVGKGTVGQTYSGPIKFTLAPGGAAFVAGDSFTVTILRPEVIGDAWAPLVTDGSFEAAGILFTQIRVPAFSVSLGVQQAVVHVRDCEVRASDLTWPAGFTGAQIAEATLQLERRGIILR